MNQPITISTIIKAPTGKTWECYTIPGHIMKWNNASDDWHTPSATNDLRQGGKFSYRMESRDGKSGFDFEGTYDEVKENEIISYTMPDSRKVRITFTSADATTNVVVEFDAEGQHSIDMQRQGWQSILDNFKKHVEECTDDKA